MLISKQELITLAKQQGYRPEILEKVLWLPDILEQINELPFADNEKEFLSQVHKHGIIDPDLICSDEIICERISNHPALKWRASLVRGTI
jgi:hypothetical protein